MKIAFCKYQGTGNDFILIDGREGLSSLPAEKVAALCHRRFGIGADGLIRMIKRDGKWFMDYRNADGSLAEMCGNGARCFARYSARLMPEKPASLSFETQAGVITAKLEGDLVSLDMGRPTDHRAPQVFDLGGASHEIHFLNTGVPHAVVFVSDVEKVDVQNLGRTIRRHEAFAPKGTNANFAQALDQNHLVLRTYERGVEGETLACGTGVCATALLHALATGAESPVHVTVRGGDTLRVDFTKDADGSFASAKLTGPADFVFDGVISL